MKDLKKMNKESVVGNTNKTLLVAFSLALALLSGCASVSMEQGYVFSAADAIDPWMPAPLGCDNVKKYYTADGKPPAYFTLYEDDGLRAHVSLVPATHQDSMWVGPGVIVPLPIFPNPVGIDGQIKHHYSPHQSIQPFRIAVYPVAYKLGYRFTPKQVKIKVGGQWQTPSNITYYASHNAGELIQTDYPADTIELKSHSTEYQMYLLDFDINVDSYANPVEAIRMAGFDFQEQAIKAKQYPLSYAEIKRFDWWKWSCR